MSLHLTPVSLVALGLRVGHCPLRKAPVARRSTQAAAPLPGEARPHPRSPPLVLAAHGSRRRARGSACRRQQVLSPRLPLRGARAPAGHAAFYCSFSGAGPGERVSPFRSTCVKRKALDLHRLAGLIVVVRPETSLCFVNT